MALLPPAPANCGCGIGDDCAMSPPRKRRRTPRLDPEVRSAQILEAALELVAEDGANALTIEAVAKAAGITRPVVYDLFGDLDGLIEALTDDAERRATETIAEALPGIDLDADPDRILETPGFRFLAAVEAEPLLWKLILAPEEGMTQEMSERIGAVRGRVAERVADLVRWGFRERPELGAIDPYVFGRVIIAAAEEMARLVVVNPKRYPPQRVATEVARFVRLFAPPRKAA